MDRRFHKRALAAAAAVLTLTSAVTSVSAAQKNEITISSNTSTLRSGDSFNLKIGYTPDSIGVSGLTIDLHYDPNAVTLNVPDENSYNVSSEFALVTNFEYDGHTVRIVGADMNANNVRTATSIGYLSFTVNDGYEGEIKFWTDVDTLVYSSGSSFVNADYTANNYIMTALPKKAQTETTTTEAKTEPPAQTTAQTTTTSLTTTTPASLPEQIIPETTVMPETTSASETNTPETESDRYGSSDTAPETSEAVYETTAPQETPSDPEALFTHIQGVNDYVNDEALQYSFSPYDFSDYEIYGATVDITVNVNSTDTVVGGIGMMTSDGWKVFDGQNTVGQAQWTAKNIDLSDVEGDISVQIYYLKNNSTFSINSISIVPSGINASGDTDSQEDQVQTEEPENTESPSASDSSEPADDQIPENNGTTNDPTESAYQQGSSQADIDSSTPDTYDNTSFDISENNSSESSSSPADNTGSSANTSSSADTSSSGDSTATTGSNNTDPAQVENTVKKEKEMADSNPDTGKKVAPEFFIAGGLIVASVAQIGYSFYSLNKMNKKNK